VAITSGTLLLKTFETILRSTPFLGRFLFFGQGYSPSIGTAAAGIVNLLMFSNKNEHTILARAERYFSQRGGR